MQNASSLGHPPDQSFIKPMAIVRAFGTASNQGSIYSPRKKKGSIYSAHPDLVLLISLCSMLLLC